MPRKQIPNTPNAAELYHGSGESKEEIQRHSTEHVMAMALMRLWPHTQRGVGPAIEDGFYQDFIIDGYTITPQDLPKITDAMEKIRDEKIPFKKSELSIDEAIAFYRKDQQPLKVEILGDLKKAGEKTVTIYTTGEYIDLCRGPHVEDTSQIGFFKLDRLAGAYWRGSEKNQMLQRLYALCYPSSDQLTTAVTHREEAEKKDHRKIGRDLDLFVFSDLVGRGLPLLTPKGAAIRRELERFVVDEEIKRGYQHVVTPPLAKVDLYRTSGHYPYYKDTMYPAMQVEEDELILRPMTCPHHFMLYKSRPRSYKELPIRFAELASQFRFEKSGELTGLMRVRMFCLADAHIFATVDQAPAVMSEVLDLIDYANGIFGLEKGVDYRYRLSLGDRQEEKKFYKDDDAWDKAEKTLRQVLEDRKAPYFVGPGEAAFYGPKIDIQLKNALGKEETAFTVQYDFVMPKRFQLTYIEKDGQERQPVVIHRSSIGAFERTMAFLIEKYSGAFPVWLSPIQAEIIPITDRQAEYAKKIEKKLIGENIRAETDDRSETMQAKIRDAQLQKVPYMLVVGDQEQTSGTVAVRLRTGENLGAMPTDDLIAKLKESIAKKSNL